MREESVLLVVSQYLGSQRAAADVQAAQSRVDLAQALYDQAADLLEVVDDRSNKSTIVTSQLPVNHWHEGLGDPTVADAILDRLLERAHRIKLVGESRRRAKTTGSPSNKEQR